MSPMDTSLNSAICRFCLETNMDLLSEMFVHITPHQTIQTINTTIKQMLQLIHIQVCQTDGYPNWICRNCKSFLYSVQRFISKAKQSKLRFEQMSTIDELPQRDQHLRYIRAEDNQDNVMCDESDDATEERQGTVDWTTQDALHENSADAINFKQEDVELEEPREPEWFDEHDDERVKEEDVVESIKIEKCDDEEEPFEFVSSATRTVTVSIEETEILPSFEYLRELKPTARSKRCPICGIESTALSVHIRTHTNVRPYQCDQCEKAFFSSNKLKCHIKSAHSNERSFSCEVCGKCFALAKTLRSHELSHTDEKKYICTLCPKRFIFRWALAKHVRTHTGEKPYPCTHGGCGKHFASSSNLRQHEKTHLHPSERTASCDICGTQVKSKHSLKIHKRSKHRSTDCSNE